jgi:hypothetical protein
VLAATMTRKPLPADEAAAIIHDTITEYKRRHDVARKNLSIKQRRAIEEAKVGYAMGNLDEKSLRRTIESVLEGIAE